MAESLKVVYGKLPNLYTLRFSQVVYNERQRMRNPVLAQKQADGWWGASIDTTSTLVDSFPACPTFEAAAALAVARLEEIGVKTTVKELVKERNRQRRERLKAKLLAWFRSL